MTQEKDKQVAGILDVFHGRRKPYPGETAEQVNDGFGEAITKRVKEFVEGNKPVELLFTGFPDKSGSRKKTLSNSADKADEIGISYLASMIDEIAEVYPKGAILKIYSDGGAFEGICGEEYTTEDRVKYLEKVRGMVSSLGKDDQIIIRDSEGLDLSEFKEEKDSFKGRVKNPKTSQDQNTQTLYNGLERFWKEELSGLRPDSSKSQIKKEAKQRAVDVAIMSVAFSDYIAGQEPDAIRLSCHPKSLDSGKIGVWLNEDHTHATPWHNAAVRTDREDYTGRRDKWEFKHAEDARKLGFEVTRDEQGNPSHYDISEKFYDHVYSNKQPKQEVVEAAEKVQRTFRERIAQKQETLRNKAADNVQQKTIPSLIRKGKDDEGKMSDKHDEKTKYGYSGMIEQQSQEYSRAD